MKLKTIQKSTKKKMKVVKEDCLAAFRGMFGFSEETLLSGHFQGTILRLPLRQNPTALSEIVYDSNKVHELLSSFREEANLCLLFLKSIARIDILSMDSIFAYGNPGEITRFTEFSVYIGGSNVEDVTAERNQFSSEIRDTENQTAPRTISSTYLLTIYTEDIESTEGCTWTVANTYKGEDMSTEMKKLARDKDLSYSPCVGAAIPVTSLNEFTGHVFCFLPLPLQYTSLTGFPVHVNGFLALSQNRRHVKWPTADQVKHSAHQDKPIRWNECLAKEAISEVYHDLIKTLIEESQSHGNRPDMVQKVIQSLPDLDKVTENWSIVVPPLLEHLEEVPFLFTQNGGGRWIRIQDAVFKNSVPKGEI